MGVERPGLPFSPTAIGMATGMDVPGGPPDAQEATALNAACPEPVRATRRGGATAAARTADLTDVIPGQSGAEALAALPDEHPVQS